MADTLNMVSRISFIAAGSFFVIAIILFIVLKIPSVLAGLYARKAGKPMKTKQRNKKMQKKSRGTAETMAQSDTSPMSLDDTKPMSSDNTRPISKDATAVMINKRDTVPLKDRTDNTGKRTGGMNFEYIENIMIIHTEEVI